MRCTFHSRSRQRLVLTWVITFHVFLPQTVVSFSSRAFSACFLVSRDGFWRCCWCERQSSCTETQRLQRVTCETHHTLDVAETQLLSWSPPKSSKAFCVLREQHSWSQRALIPNSSAFVRDKLHASLSLRTRNEHITLICLRARTDSISKLLSCLSLTFPELVFTVE